MVDDRILGEALEMDIGNAALIIRTGSAVDGQLWTAQQVALLRQVLSRAKYDSTSAGAIAEQLCSSLEENAEDQGWSAAQITLLDSVFDHMKFTDDDGGDIADTLIASLRGQPIDVTYPDVDEVNY